MAFDFEMQLNKVVFLHLFPGSEVNSLCTNRLLKKHTYNLWVTGDLSFSLKCKVFRSYLETNFCSTDCGNTLDCCNMLSTLKEKIEQMKNCSRDWVYPLKTVCIRGDRCYLYLNRFSAFKVTFHKLFQRRMINSGKAKQLYIERKLWSEDMSLACYRTYLISEVLRRIAIYSGWDVVSEPNDSCLKLSLNQAQEAPEKNEIKYITCGLVLDPMSKKELSVTYSEYKKLRISDMQLRAMHKYEITRDPNWFCSLVDELGRAAIIIDLLEVKATSPILIKGSGHGSTRGASFILYNSSRVENILKSFEIGVKVGKYASLPSLDQIDFAALKEEDEWQLLFNYILPFPYFLEKYLLDIETGKCSLHLVCQFLNGLIALFSTYYRRTRVLLESRKHLIAVIHARIYLLKAVRQILNTILDFFGISPMQTM